MILITGGTGFIGKYVVRTFAARGLRLRVSVRRHESVSLLPSTVETVVVGDLNGPVHWGPALVGVRTIIHLAGRAHVLRRTSADEERLYWSVNASATRALAEAAADSGVHRLIFLSSSRAIGDETPPGTWWDEETPCSPQDAYGRSKLEAERALIDVSQRHGLQVVILRPPVVYGAGVTANIYEFFKFIDRGIPLPVGLVNNRRSLLYVGNLVDAIYRVTEAPQARGLYHVTDGEYCSTPELARQIGRALGRPARLLPMPAPVLRLAGHVGDLVERTMHLSLPLTSENVIRLLASLSLDATKIRRTLAWTPPWTMEAGLSHTAQWFRETQASLRRL